ncbi:UNVERIFIED_CONTAM: protein disulfide isomerase-like 1-4 [Sesamum calycinum]|uniref:protein disulfide-isomerase n=1 Tax=Sesamum calycinum TaxID=2727403 RepID=A0AAW2LVA0_9LAMI
MGMKSLIILSIFLFSICSNLYLCSSKSEEDEDISFLEQQEQNEAASWDDGHPRDYENYDDLEDDEWSASADEDGGYSAQEVDETHVVVLKGSNFSDFIAKNRFVMVEFYAPWCGHCQALAPEYAAAAEELKDEAVVLAKVDATEEAELSQKFDVQGFPTIYFFVDGVHKPYPGQRTKDAIVAWLKKKIGPESEELAGASKLEDDVSFYQTTNPDVAKLFQIDPNAKRPILVMLKREPEKLNQFGGQLTKSAIAEFVFENKLPLVTNFTRESAPLVFENPIKKQLISVYVELDNEDVEKQVSEYFGVSEEAATSFGEKFLGDNLKPFYKSDPIPKKWLATTLMRLYLDESKDVLLEIHAPWCGHCQALEPIYNKLGKHLRGIESLVIAKMDGTTNEHPRAKPDGFPTILFFPAGNKSFDPITFEGDRTVVAFYKFLKKHASIPFKLQKPASPEKSTATDTTVSHESSSSSDVKDEL